MNHLVYFSQRLRELRKERKLNQEEFGKLGGVTTKTQMLYEKGERRPGADYLAKIAAEGVDVGYILTGVRDGDSAAARITAIAKVAAIPIAMGLDSEKAKVVIDEELSDKEIELIVNYRTASEDGKVAIETTADALARQAEK